MYRESDHEEASELCNKTKIVEVKPRKIQKNPAFPLGTTEFCSTWNHPKNLQKSGFYLPVGFFIIQGLEGSLLQNQDPTPWCDKFFFR